MEISGSSDGPAWPRWAVPDFSPGASPLDPMSRSLSWIRTPASFEFSPVT